MCKFFKHARNMNEIDRIYNALIKELGGPILDHVIIMARGRRRQIADPIYDRARARAQKYWHRRRAPTARFQILYIHHAVNTSLHTKPTQTYAINYIK